MPTPRDGDHALGRAEGWAPLHETDPAAVAGGAGGDATTHDGPAGAVAETGTTIVGVTTDDATVLAADRRASLGGRFVASKSVEKIDGVHPTAAVAGSGSVGGLQQFVSALRAEASLYERRRGDTMSLTALSTLAGNLLASMPLPVVPLLGGVDEDGPTVYQLDPGGGVMDTPYAAGGSGMQVAYGVLEREFDADADPETAADVAANAVAAATERDTASGNGLTLATLTAEGMDTAERELEAHR